MDSTKASAARPPRVLVAADDGDELELLVATLAQDGCDVVGFPGAAELAEHLDGLARTAEPEPAWIALDVFVPGESGIDLLESLRRHGWTTPVLLVTDYASRDLRARVEGAGRAALIEKPFTLWKLRHVLRPSRSRAKASASVATTFPSLVHLARRAQRTGAWWFFLAVLTVLIGSAIALGVLGARLSTHFGDAVSTFTLPNEPGATHRV